MLDPLSHETPGADTIPAGDPLAVLAADYEDAMERALILPPAFKAAMDDAAVTGKALSMEAILAITDESHIFPPGCTWDGCGKSGKPLDFVEDLAWCTLRRWYGWGLPSAEALETIAPYIEAQGGLIEVGAGSGYWSAVVSAHTGLPVKAYDNASWRSDRWDDPWHPISPDDALVAVRENPSLPILIVWADPCGVGGHVAEAMSPGQILIHAGPVDSTGDKEFHRQLETLFDIEATGPDVFASGNQGHIHVLRKRSAAKETPNGIFIRNVPSWDQRSY